MAEQQPKRLLSDIVNEIANLIEKTNVEEAKTLRDWFRQWFDKTGCWRAPECEFSNWVDVSMKLQELCKGKEYEQEAKRIFRG